MRICILNVIHDAYDKRVYHKIGLSLAGAGHDVISICPPPSSGPLPTMEGERDQNGICFRFTRSANNLPRRFLAALRLIRLAVQTRADVFVAPEPESWAAALVAKLFGGGRVVLDMHEHIPSEFAKFFPGVVRSFVERLTVWVMRLMARGTDLVILTRRSFEAPWKGLAVPRVTVINTNRLQAPCSEIPDELKAEFGGYPVIIHQGIFGDIRGSYQLLDTVKILTGDFPNVRCIVLGDYVYGSFDDYRRRVQALGLSENVVFVPPVSFDRVPAYIALSQVGLILFQPGPVNHTLAMPHKLFDYMREGRPVVVPDFAEEVSRIVREADCGILVDVTRPEAIAAAVSRLLADPEEAARLGGNGRRLVETKYNWQREEAVLLAAFAKLGSH